MGLPHGPFGRRDVLPVDVLPNMALGYTWVLLALKSLD